MGRIKRFEDVKAWQRARDLVREVYILSRKCNFARDFGLRDQIQRAAVSVMSNIAEGFERYSDKELIQFLNISRASAGEVRSHLYVAFDLGYISKKEFSEVKENCESVSGQIWGFIRYLKTGL